MRLILPSMLRHLRKRAMGMRPVCPSKREAVAHRYSNFRFLFPQRLNNKNGWITVSVESSLRANGAPVALGFLRCPICSRRSFNPPKSVKTLHFPSGWGMSRTTPGQRPTLVSNLNGALIHARSGNVVEALCTTLEFEVLCFRRRQTILKEPFDTHKVTEGPCQGEEVAPTGE